LKSPLRGIFLLSQWIEEDLQAGKAAVLAEHMTLMRNRVQRMENLLDDLLTYSRVGRLEGALGMVNVAELARSLFELQAPPPGFRLELAADLPSFSTLGTPFEQVLRNLLSNAVKHHDRAEGAVRLDSAPVGEDFYAFTVSDDGPGIAPQYQERVFGMFQTLKPRDVVEGSGMGLALVKKIVERYGGRVVLRSDGVRGCAVTFTWPCTLAGRAKDDVGGD
jgi:signal transduction histidine kinase